ncbi:MAG: hypothetical protein HYW08_16975, partial [candidate division NC10 bacterium]|nr:hypothetical protein [candidate division NC10 bacterium]
YRVRSRDAAGNLATSGDFTFTTLASSPNPGLAAYWAFEEGTGTTAADSSGNGNTGTLVNGPAWTAGRIGQGLAFDGLTNYVTVPSTAALNAYPLTVAVWMKTDSTTGVRGVVNKYLAGSYNGYQVFLNNGNLCAWYLRDAANYVYDGSGCPFNLAGYTDNQWHHVVYVVDASGGRLYVDGVQKGSLAWTGTAGPPSTTQPIHLAHYPGAFGGAEYFPGLLDDVRIYTRALSAAEILSLYTAADSTPPTVSITAPISGATVIGTITAAASATDNVGVVGVQFKLDGANLGTEVTAAPYSVSWNTTTAGNGAHTLTAVARDAAGNTATSGGVTVSVSNDITAPVISGVAVSNLSSSGATVTWATDEGSDSQVEYGPTIAYGSLTPLDTTKVTAHAQVLSGLAAGTLYHYRVKSRDAAGNLATSGDFTFTTLAASDTMPPSVSMTAPASGSTVTGTVTVAANATDNVGVAGVQFKLDGANLGAEVTTAPYGISWNTTTATNGSHTLTAVARDAAGNTTTSAGVSVTVANDTSNPGLVGYWKVDEGSGTTATDSSGNGNTGTLMNGPTWTVGKLNSALSFDGLTNYVSVPHTAALDAYPLSVAVWMKTASTSGVRGIVNKYAAGSFNGYQLFMNNGNLCAWYLRDTSNYVYDGGGCTFNLAGYNDNQWHHVAFVVDASGGRLYVDGLLKGSLAWTGTAGPPSTTQPIHLAHYPGAFGGAEYFPGLLDDVRIYTRALSA